VPRRALLVRAGTPQQGDGPGDGGGPQLARARAEPPGDLVGAPLALYPQVLEGVGDGAARGVRLDVGVRRVREADRDLARDAGQADVGGAVGIEVHDHRAADRVGPDGGARALDDGEVAGDGVEPQVAGDGLGLQVAGDGVRADRAGERHQGRVARDALHRGRAPYARDDGGGADHTHLDPGLRRDRQGDHRVAAPALAVQQLQEALPGQVLVRHRQGAALLGDHQGRSLDLRDLEPSGTFLGAHDVHRAVDDADVELSHGLVEGEFRGLRDGPLGHVGPPVYAPYRVLRDSRYIAPRRLPRHSFR